MGQSKLDGREPKRAWFVRVGPFGGMMPWSVMGCAWFILMLAGTLVFGLEGNRMWTGLDLRPVSAVVLIIGLVVALKKSTRL